MKQIAFICHSKQDDEFAKKIVTKLEENKISCWIAPRNIPAGSVWAEAIMEALESCTIMVLLLSSHSNKSPQVLTEIETAKDQGIPIIPIKIEDVQLSHSMKYHVRSYQWIEAYGKSNELAFEKLVDSVKKNLSELEHQEINGLTGKDQKVQKKEEYKEIFDTFWEDKSVSEKERNLLKKTQTRLGLTDEEVSEIEEEYKTENEIEKQNNKTKQLIDVSDTKTKSKPSFVQELKKICHRYGENKNFFMSYFIPETKLNSFRTALLVPNSENVIALIDLTTFGSKKEGVVISEEGLYWRSKANNPRQISWSSFKNASILSVDKTSITIGGMILNTRTSKFDKEVLLELLNRIKTLL